MDQDEALKSERVRVRVTVRVIRLCRTGGLCLGDAGRCTPRVRVRVIT